MGNTQRRSFSWFLTLIFLALSAQVVYLARQNRELKAALTEAQRSTNDSNELMFQSGETFPPFAYRNADGSVRNIDFTEGRTLLYVTAAACPICPQIVPRWEEVTPFFQDAGTDILGLLLDQQADELAAWIEGVPLGSLADVGQVPLAKLKTVPLTILIAEGGIIEWVHYGTLTDKGLAEMHGHLP